MSELCSRVGPLKRGGGDQVAAATERVKRKTDFAVVEERRRWEQSAKSRGKGVYESLADGVPTALKTVPAGFGQKTSAILTENSGPQSSEVRSVALPVSVRSVQVTGDVGRQRSVGSGSARQEGEGRGKGKLGP